MAGMYYFADGFLREQENDIRQSTWVCIYNPTPLDASIDFTFYYENDAPTDLRDYQVQGHRAGSLHLLSCPQVLPNKRFGAGIRSNVPIIVQITTGYYGLDDKHDWYTRAMHSVLCADRLSRTLYYADGLVIDKPGQRLKEPEWDFILNPNQEPAHVTLYAQYHDGEQQSFDFTVGAQRLVCFFKDPMVRANHLFGGKYVSDRPIAVQQTRLIEEEDRTTIRSCYSVMAQPGPLPGDA